MRGLYLSSRSRRRVDSLLEQRHRHAFRRLHLDQVERLHQSRSRWFLLASLWLLAACDQQDQQEQLLADFDRQEQQAWFLRNVRLLQPRELALLRRLPKCNLVVLCIRLAITPPFCLLWLKGILCSVLV